MTEVVPMKRLKTKDDGYCYYCQNESASRLRHCDSGAWVTFCEACFEGITVCAHCKQATCSMRVVGEMKKEEIMSVFRASAGALQHMNPHMYIKFTDTTVEVGVEHGPTVEQDAVRNAKAATAVAVVLGDKGVVRLLDGDSFVGWSITERRIEALTEDINMARTVINDDKTTATKDLGSASKWAAALCYSNERPYPTLVGHTANDGTVEIALACNPNLPGFLMKARDPTLDKTVISPVDIPASVWHNIPTVNDERVKVLSIKNCSEVFVLHVSVYYVRYGGWRPTLTSSSVDDEGCLCETYEVRRNVTVHVSVKSLAAATLEHCYVNSKGQEELHALHEFKNFWENPLYMGSELMDHEEREGHKLVVTAADGSKHAIYKVTFLP